MKIEEYLGLVSNLNDHSKNYLYHCIFVQFVYFMKESTLSRADSLTPAKTVEPRAPLACSLSQDKSGFQRRHCPCALLHQRSTILC